MECELCGKSVGSLTEIMVEGSPVKVCLNCVKFGQEPEKKVLKKREKPMPMSELESEDLVSDYGTRIKKAREDKKISREDFARDIGERESVIKRIENNEMTPDIELVKRIERYLEVNLSD